MKRLIEATQFSMAHQDVRYYLNGMLFETEGEELRTVATDGHRLAVCSMPIGQSLPSHSVIVPRKGVIELMRMLDGGDNPLRVQIGSNNIRAHVGDFIFTSKLVDGRFPDYRRVLPKNPDKHLEAGCGSPQAGVCSRGNSQREIPRCAPLCQRKPAENHRQQPGTGRSGRRSSTLPIAVRRWKSASTSAMCWMF